MKIAINLLPFRRNLTGTGVYAYNIIDALGKIDSENEYILFANKENSCIFNFLFINFNVVVFPFNAKNTFARIFWEQFIFPFFLKKYHIDLLFSPSVVLPVLSTCKNVICVHDLIPFHIKSKYTQLRSFYIKLMTKASARKAEKVLTVSLNSKKEIEKYCKVPGEKISITYNGINREILNPNQSKWEHFKIEKKIPKQYILYVGTLEPGKNLITLIRSFKILKDDNRISHKLVIAGGKGWLFESIFIEVEKHKLETEVIFTNYVPNDILGLLYKNAEVFILPSLYEGFGIPALEAMYFGTPVIVSNTSSLPEVVGTAGKLTNPLSESNIATTIHEVLSDASLRKRMIEQGYEQAAKFSWRKSAQVIYDEFLKLNSKSLG
jgi:glycosyltransferase involved in cell wall biosynthesis